jgi:hypothetical protein
MTTLDILTPTDTLVAGSPKIAVYGVEDAGRLLLY